MICGLIINDGAQRSTHYHRKRCLRALINDVYQIDPFVTKEEIEELVALTFLQIYSVA